MQWIMRQDGSLVPGARRVRLERSGSRDPLAQDVAYARIGLKFDVNLIPCHAAAVTPDRAPLGPDATEDEIMARITEAGAEQVAAQEAVDALDDELRPLLPRAYALGHFPTELAGLTRWDRGQVRLIIDPGAARVGRKARDPEREPRRPGRKPRVRAGEEG